MQNILNWLQMESSIIADLKSCRIRKPTYCKRVSNWLLAKSGFRVKKDFTFCIYGEGGEEILQNLEISFTLSEDAPMREELMHI